MVSKQDAIDALQAPKKPTYKLVFCTYNTNFEAIVPAEPAFVKLKGKCNGSGALLALCVHLASEQAQHHVRFVRGARQYAGRHEPQPIGNIALAIAAQKSPPPDGSGLAIRCA